MSEAHATIVECAAGGRARAIVTAYLAAGSHIGREPRELEEST